MPSYLAGGGSRWPTLPHVYPPPPPPMCWLQSPTGFGGAAGDGTGGALVAPEGPCEYGPPWSNYGLGVQEGCACALFHCRSVWHCGWALGLKGSFCLRNPMSCERDEAKVCVKCNAVGTAQDTPPPRLHIRRGKGLDTTSEPYATKVCVGDVYGLLDLWAL